jgi:hypothetical protein
MAPLPLAVLLGVLDEPADDDLPAELEEPEPLDEPAALPEPLDFGSELAAVALDDLGAEVAEDDPLLEEDDEPEDEPPVLICIPGGIVLVPVPEDLLPLVDEDEADDDETLLAGVGLAGAGGRVTATVLPPLPVLLDEAALDEDDEPLAGDAFDGAGGRVTATVLPPLPAAAAGPAAAEASGEAESVGALVAVGPLAVDEVSFWDHKPISDKTPARTAIAMIAPITQDVLFVSPSPVSSGSPGSLFGFAIFAPVAMVYAEIVCPKR